MRYSLLASATLNSCIQRIPLVCMTEKLGIHKYMRHLVT